MKSEPINCFLWFLVHIKFVHIVAHDSNSFFKNCWHIMDVPQFVHLLVDIWAVSSLGLL